MSLSFSTGVEPTTSGSATPPEGDPLEVCRQRKSALLDVRHRLEIIEIQLAQAIDELQSFENFTLTSLIGTLTGKRQARIAEGRETIERLQAEYEAAGAQLEKLDREVGQLEAGLQGSDRRTPPASSSAESSAVHDTAASGGLVRRLERAVAACEEARRDLLSEMETTGFLGKCRVAEGYRVLKMLGNAVRKGAADEAACHVRQSLRRLCRRLDDAADGDAHAADPAVVELLEALRTAADSFATSWFTAGEASSESAPALEQQLQMAGMYLEKQLLDARRAAGGPVCAP